jgi:hypothetical protein
MGNSDARMGTKLKDIGDVGAATLVYERCRSGLVRLQSTILAPGDSSVISRWLLVAAAAAASLSSHESRPQETRRS